MALLYDSRISTTKFMRYANNSNGVERGFGTVTNELNAITSTGFVMNKASGTATVYYVAVKL